LIAQLTRARPRPENVDGRLPLYALPPAPRACRQRPRSCARRSTHAAQQAYLADKAAGKANFEPDLREHLARLRTECDRRVARQAATLEAKDPEIRAAPAISALVDCEASHALDEAVRLAEEAAAAPGVVMDAGVEARARAAVDARALAQASAVVQSFTAFTDKLALAADGPRQAELGAAIAAKLAEAERLGESGDVDGAQRLTEEAEGLQRLKDTPPPRPTGVEAALTVRARLRGGSLAAMRWDGQCAIARLLCALPGRTAPHPPGRPCGARLRAANTRPPGIL